LSSQITIHSVKGALAAEYHGQPYYFELVQSAVTGFFKTTFEKKENGTTEEIQRAHTA